MNKNDSILKEIIADYGDKEKGTEQFLIRFRNLLTNHLGGWWCEHKYKSVGNIIHWIYVYSMLSIAETVTIGDGVVNHHGVILATYVFDDELKMPVFEFSKDEKYDWVVDNQRIYLEGLRKPALTIDIIEKYAKLYNLK